MSPGEAGGGRLAREREHHRLIAPRAEIVWSWDSPTGRQRAARRSRMFLDHALLAPGVRALEIGCGTGVFLEAAARSGATIDGIDASSDLLARARERTGQAPNVSLVCGDVERMPYSDASFDAAYGSSVLHHLNLAEALREIRRVLRPGGRIVFAEPNLLNPHIAFTYLVGPRARFGLSDDEMAFTRFHARRKLEQAGFSEIAIQPYDFLHPLVPRILIEAVLRLGRGLERLPLVREIAGSLLIQARTIHEAGPAVLMNGPRPAVRPA
jgi:SAM-dependent methyltransferase